MSAIYRFGFEHGFVPSGVNIIDGQYLYIGREGNCSLYGNWPRVECELESTNKIRGSFAALSYAHELRDIKNQYHIDFGPVRLRQHLSGHISIDISGERVASIGGFDVTRGYWYPIQFLIEPGRVEFIYDTYPLIYEGDFGIEPQTIIKIAGLGATGCLEDIALNTATGIFDTGIPNLYAGLPLFYTGSLINNFKYVASDNVLDNYNELSTGKFIDNNSISQYCYCPINNYIYFGSVNYGSGINLRDINYLNLNTYQTGKINNVNLKTINNIQDMVVNSFTYCPSRNTMFCITGGGLFGSTRTDLAEIDPFTNNIIDSYIISTTIKPYNGCSMIYNEKRNALYLNIDGSSSNFFVFDCKSCSSTNLSITGARTTMEQQWTTDIDGNIYFLYYLSTIYHIEKATLGNTYNNIYQTRQRISCPSVSSYQTNNRLLILDKLNSGVFGLKKSTNLGSYLFLFNKDDLSILSSGLFHTYPYIYTSPFYYDKFTNKFFYEQSIIDLSNTGNYTVNNFAHTITAPADNLGNSLYNYIPTKNSLIISQTSLLNPQRYLEYNLNTLTIHSGESGLFNYNYILNNDSLKTMSEYDDANGKLYLNNSIFTGYEGMNIISNFRKERSNSSSLSIGTISGSNISILGNAQNNIGGSSDKSYSILYTNGQKLSDSGANEVNVYFKYDRNLDFIDGD